MPRKIEISHKTIIFTVLFLLLLWFLYNVRDLILQLFVAVLIMAILNPLVTKLSKLKIPRTISVLLSYLVVFGIFGFAIAAIIPPLVDQTSGFAVNLPKYLANIGVERVISEKVAGDLVSQLGSLPGQVVRFSISVFSNILGVIAVLIFAFYLLVSRDRLDDQLGFFF